MNIRNFLVKIGLRGLTSTQKVDKGRNHVAMLTANATYPTLQAGLPEISTACDNLDESILEVLFNGGKIAFDRKNVREKELNELITYLGNQVQVLSFGDKSNILSAGFDVRRTASPIFTLDAPKGLRASISPFKGTIDLRWNPVHGTKVYELFMTAGDPNDEKGWVPTGVSTRCTRTVRNLETGTTYSFRVNAVGANAQSAFSSVAHSIAA